MGCGAAHHLYGQRGHPHRCADDARPAAVLRRYKESAECIRRVNEVSAEIKKQYPGRFKFCAALPLPDVDAAIREAVYALDTLGADGVKLATNSRGQYLATKNWTR